MFRSRIYGVSLASNRAIVGLPSGSTEEPSLLVDFVEDRPCSSSARLVYELREDAESEAYLSVYEDHCGAFHLRFLGGSVYRIEANFRNITAFAESGETDELHLNLIGGALTLLLRLRGCVCLHASGVVVHDSAVLIIGPSGYGKSSTAAAFALLGVPVLTEDVAAIAQHGDQFFLQPGHPRIRLWPHSADLLLGDHARLGLLAPNWEKRFIDLTRPGFHFQDRPLPIRAIYGLDLDSPLSPSETLIWLASSTLGSRILKTEGKTSELKILAQLAGSIPIKPAARFYREGDPFAIARAIEKEEEVSV